MIGHTCFHPQESDLTPSNIASEDLRTQKQACERNPWVKHIHPKMNDLVTLSCGKIAENNAIAIGGKNPALSEKVITRFVCLERPTISGPSLNLLGCAAGSDRKLGYPKNRQLQAMRFPRWHNWHWLPGDIMLLTMRCLEQHHIFARKKGPPGCLGYMLEMKYYQVLVGL